MFDCIGHQFTKFKLLLSYFLLMQITFTAVNKLLTNLALTLLRKKLFALQAKYSMKKERKQTLCA